MLYKENCFVLLRVTLGKSGRFGLGLNGSFKLYSEKRLG